MDLGFETIGNATLIVHDEGPKLVTDPWLSGNAYFGSWTMPYEIPLRQREAINSCPFVWLSHGHPDHLDAATLPALVEKQILLPDHVGGRIYGDLTAGGFKVRVLRDREWVELTPRIRVLSIADPNQDALLLVDAGGALLINTNDASDQGWGPFVRKTAHEFRSSFLFAIAGYGDADMINFFDESGSLITPDAAARNPIGPRTARQAEAFGVRYRVPFSSLHRYQRRDSIWANRYVANLVDYREGWDSRTCELLPAFIRFDLAKDRVEEISPAALPERIAEPEEFGDRWSDQLEADEVTLFERYFKRIERLAHYLDFVTVRVGGKEHTLRLGTENNGRGVTFETPRQSLVTALRYEVFDDLLIGNFTRTHLHGNWRQPFLYPHLNPIGPKYADNGRAYTSADVDAYLEAYRKRAPFAAFQHRIKGALASSSAGLRLFQAAASLRRRMSR
jgi:L-ascorbate metabolism protein UlaG (beta-lactamase superfamily)